MPFTQTKMPKGFYEGYTKEIHEVFIDSRR